MNSPSSRPDSLVSAIKGGAQKVALPAALALASTFSANVAQAQIEPETFAGVRGVECEGDCSILIDESNPTNATVYATPGHVANVKIQCPPGFTLDEKTIKASLPKDFAEKGKTSKMYDAPRAGTTGMNFLPVSFPNVNMPLADDPSSQQRAVITAQCTGEGADAVDYELGVVSTKAVPAYGHGAGIESTGGALTGGSRKKILGDMLHVGMNVLAPVEHAKNKFYNGVGINPYVVLDVDKVIPGFDVGLSVAVVSNADSIENSADASKHTVVEDRLTTSEFFDIGYHGLDGFIFQVGAGIAQQEAVTFTAENGDKDRAPALNNIGMGQFRLGMLLGKPKGLNGVIGISGRGNIRHDGPSQVDAFVGARF